MAIQFNNLLFKNIKNFSQSDIQVKPTQKQIESSNLIAEVKERPELWCKSKTNPHKTRENRSVVWTDVIEKLGIESIEEGKRRWEILRDIFRRELKKDKFPNSNEYKSTWYHFNEMMFLTDVQVKQNFSNKPKYVLALEERQKKFEKEQKEQQQKEQPYNIKTYKNKKKVQKIQQQQYKEQQNKKFEDNLNNTEIKSEHTISDEEGTVQESIHINANDDNIVDKIPLALPIPTTTLETNNLSSIRKDHLKDIINNDKFCNVQSQLDVDLIENTNNKQKPTIKCKSLNQLTDIKVKERKISKKCTTKTKYSSTSTSSSKILNVLSSCEQPETKKLKKSIDLEPVPIITQKQIHFIPSVISENSILNDGDNTTSSSPVHESNDLQTNCDLHKKMIESSDYHFAMSMIPFMKTVTESNKLRMRMRLVQVLLEENLRTEEV